MSQEKKQSSLLEGWNAPPNLVTYSRIILVFVFLGLYIASGPWGGKNIGMRWAAAIIFIIAASTDKIDGWMARKYGQVTEMGKLMDPIADKLLTLGTLIVAACFNEFGNPVLGWIITALFIIREVGITVMRFFVIDTGGKVIAASSLGKLKTLSQCVGLGMLMLPFWSCVHIAYPLQATARDLPVWLNIYFVITYALIYFSLILCLYSGWDYVRQVLNNRKK